MVASGRYAGREVVEEAVRRAVVPVELVLLAVRAELSLELIDLLRRRVPVVVAEQAEQRRRQAGDESIGATGRAGLSSSWLMMTPPPHRSATAFQPSAPARRQQRVPPARAGADDPGLAVAAGLGEQPFPRGGAVGHHAVVGHAALTADLRGDVVGSAMPVPAVQVRADDGVAVPGQPVGELAVELVPARHVMHGHDAGRDESSPVGAGDVGVNLIAVAAGIGDHLAR